MKFDNFIWHKIRFGFKNILLVNMIVSHFVANSSSQWLPNVIMRKQFCPFGSIIDFIIASEVMTVLKSSSWLIRILDVLYFTIAIDLNESVVGIWNKIKSSWITSLIYVIIWRIGKNIFCLIRQQFITKLLLKVGEVSFLFNQFKIFHVIVRKIIKILILSLVIEFPKLLLLNS